MTGPGGQQGQMSPGQHPVRLVVDYPQEFSRMQALFWTFLSIVGFVMMIPHIFWIFLQQIAVMVVNAIAFWAILFTGRYPRGMWEFQKNFVQYSVRVNMWTYCMAQGYPPFSGSDPNYGARVEIPYPESSSRLWLFFGMYAVIPVAIVGMFYAIGMMFLIFLGRFAVLFTGSFPQGWFEFCRKVAQHQLRMQCFVMWLRPEYPPFGLED